MSRPLSLLSGRGRGLGPPCSAPSLPQFPQSNDGRDGDCGAHSNWPPMRVKEKLLVSTPDPGDLGDPGLGASRRPALSSSKGLCCSEPHVGARLSSATSDLEPKFSALWASVSLPVKWVNHGGREGGGGGRRGRPRAGRARSPVTRSQAQRLSLPRCVPCPVSESVCAAVVPVWSAVPGVVRPERHGQWFETVRGRSGHAGGGPRPGRRCARRAPAPF